MAGLVFHFSASFGNYICQLRIHSWRVVDSFSYRTFRKYEKSPLGRRASIRSRKSDPLSERQQNLSLNLKRW